MTVEMELVGRGRLSVQRVEEDAYEAIREMAEKGGWDLTAGKKAKGKPKKAAKGSEEKDDEPKATGKKRKAGAEGVQEGVRRSTRTKRE